MKCNIYLYLLIIFRNSIKFNRFWSILFCQFLNSHDTIITDRYFLSISRANIERYITCSSTWIYLNVLIEIILSLQVKILWHLDKFNAVCQLLNRYSSFCVELTIIKLMISIIVNIRLNCNFTTILSIYINHTVVFTSIWLIIVCKTNNLILIIENLPSQELVNNFFCFCICCKNHLLIFWIIIIEKHSCLQFVRSNVTIYLK